MNEEQVTALKVWIMRLLARIIFVKCIKEHCEGNMVTMMSMMSMMVTMATMATMAMMAMGVFVECISEESRRQ